MPASPLIQEITNLLPGGTVPSNLVTLTFRTDDTADLPGVINDALNHTIASNTVVPSFSLTRVMRVQYVGSFTSVSNVILGINIAGPGSPFPVGYKIWALASPTLILPKTTDTSTSAGGYIDLLSGSKLTITNSIINPSGFTSYVVMYLEVPVTPLNTATKHLGPWQFTLAWTEVD